MERVLRGITDITEVEELAIWGERMRETDVLLDLYNEGGDVTIGQIEVWYPTGEISHLSEVAQSALAQAACESAFK
jgi:hypothetical protein